jgi:hypothetical protein
MKFAHAFQAALTDEGFPEHWVESAVYANLLSILFPYAYTSRVSMPPLNDLELTRHSKRALNLTKRLDISCSSNTDSENMQ